MAHQPWPRNTLVFHGTRREGLFRISPGSLRNDVLHLIFASDEDARLSIWPTAHIDIDFGKDNLRANLAWQRSGKEAFVRIRRVRSSFPSSRVGAIYLKPVSWVPLSEQTVRSGIGISLYIGARGLRLL